MRFSRARRETIFLFILMSAGIVIFSNVQSYISLESKEVQIEANTASDQQVRRLSEEKTPTPTTTLSPTTTTTTRPVEQLEELRPVHGVPGKVRQMPKRKPVAVPRHPARKPKPPSTNICNRIGLTAGQKPFKTTRGNSTGHVDSGDPKKYTAWLQTQEHRKQRVKEICELHKIDRDPPRSRAIYRQMMVDDQHQVIYCSIPKAACTSWKSMLARLTGHFDPEHPEVFRHCEHDDGFMARHGLRSLASTKFTDRDISQRLNSYTKFFTVRHPLSRLQSAYENKFRQYDTGAIPFHRHYGKLMIQHYRSKPSLVSLRTGENVTLEEFLRFVTDDSFPTSKRTEQHWMMFQSLCHPCLIDYDYIATVETLQEDSDFILDKVFNTDYRLQVLQATSRTNLTGFDSISPNVMEDIYRHFHNDFTMFEYDHLQT